MDIIERYLSFLKEEFGKYSLLFEELGQGQRPHTLFIGCSDSRVVPEIILRAGPGEIFVVRNVANIVPPYGEGDLSVSVSAAIEYAVLVLNVKNIVVCGHSNCGGCAALYKEDQYFLDKPSVKRWISTSREVVGRAEKLAKGDVVKRSELTEQLNVVKQIENLMTYPFVKDKVDSGEVKLHGWYFVIPKGEVYSYNFSTQKFELLGK